MHGIPSPGGGEGEGVPGRNEEELIVRVVESGSGWLSGGGGG